MYHTKADCANIHNNNCTKEKIGAEKQKKKASLRIPMEKVFETGGKTPSTPKKKK